MRTAHLDPMEHLLVWRLATVLRRRGPIAKRKRRHARTHQTRVVMIRGKVVPPCPMERVHFEAFRLMSDERDVGQKTIP